MLQASYPYLVPYGVFITLTAVADQFPAWRSAFYIVKVLAVAAALWHYRRSYPELRFRFSPALGVAALVGVGVIVAWIGLDPYYPQTNKELTNYVDWDARHFDHPDRVEGQFDPYEKGQLIPPVVAIIFRLIGAVLLVPIFEELLIRSWLMRLVIREQFWEVPVGVFTHISFWVGTVAMAISHHEWLAAVICSAAFNALLYWKRDIFLCVVAHAVANLALALWVLHTGQWYWW
jgi:hypothetical protein